MRVLLPVLVEERHPGRGRGLWGRPAVGVRRAQQRRVKAGDHRSSKYIIGGIILVAGAADEKTQAVALPTRRLKAASDAGQEGSLLLPVWIYSSTHF